MQTASRPRPRLHYPLVATWLLLLITALLPATLLKAQSGTADGTYNFANVGTTITNGFKTQGDKFLVSSIFVQNNVAGYTTRMYANNSAASTSSSVVLKANNTVATTFTLKDLRVTNGGVSNYFLSQFDITLKDYSGNTIATHSLGSTIAPGVKTDAGTGISAFPFTTAWPSGGITM